MAALPYMPLYVADYLADTAHLGALEHGAYLMLIMNYWQRGKPLPADDTRLARIARVDAAQWPDVKAQIAEFFTEADGEWRHKRVDDELKRVAEKSTKARESAQRSVSVRSAKASTGGEADVIPLGERKPSYTDTDTDTDTKERGARARAFFPQDGSIAFSAWADIVRREAPGHDVDLVASTFRGFCRERDIPLDAKCIEKSFTTFCGVFKRKAKAS